MSIKQSEPDCFLHIDVVQAGTPVVNRPLLRRAFGRVGRDIMRQARGLVSRRAVSRAGESPGYRSGGLGQSIGYYVPSATATRPGWMVKIAPKQTRGRGLRPLTGEFYPAFLYYGVKGPSGWRIAPRKNYMVQALHQRRAWIERVLGQALHEAIEVKR